MTRLRIRELADAQGLNITTFARRAELPYTTAHALWHDSARLWSRVTLDRVATALNVRVPDLFEGEPNKEPGDSVELAGAT